MLGWIPTYGMRTVVRDCDITCRSAVHSWYVPQERLRDYHPWTHGTSSSRRWAEWLE